jgi:hypothetical protein
MNSHLSPKDWPQLLRSSAACSLLLAHLLVMADTTTHDTTRILPPSDSGKTTAPQSLPENERIFLPESAFIQIDPDAPAPKLLAPLRPSARTVEPDSSITPQIKSRTRAASEASGQSMITHTVTSPQVSEINRVELKRLAKPPAESDKTAAQTTTTEKAAVVSAAPEQKLTPTPSLRVSEPAPTKLNPSPIYKSIATQTKPAAPITSNKMSSQVPLIERSYRLQHDISAEIPPATTVNSASSSQSEEDFLAAKNSLAESTAKLREIEKTIHDMQQMLPAPGAVQSSSLLLAALPYASVTAQDSSVVMPPSLQSNWLTNSFTNTVSTSSENTAHAVNNQTPLGQRGLLQLILFSVLAGIAGYVLIIRSGTAK